jgi:hypothetical protein
LPRGKKAEGSAVGVGNRREEPRKARAGKEGGSLSGGRQALGDTADYPVWLESLKKQVQAARARAALAVNSELICMYHRIGSDILQRQREHRWGDKIIQCLAADLRDAFPDMKGFSERNLKYMRYFAEQCPAVKIGQQPAAQLPWFHIVMILTLRYFMWVLPISVQQFQYIEVPIKYYTAPPVNCTPVRDVARRYGVIFNRVVNS